MGALTSKEKKAVKKIKGNISKFEIDEKSEISDGTDIDNKLFNPENGTSVSFQWKDGGKDIYVAGSFTNWDESPIQLFPTANGMHERILYLPPGNYKYKFIVDSEWCFSKDEPLIKDPLGTILNFIEVVVKKEASKKNLFGTAEPENLDQLTYDNVPPVPHALSKLILNVTQSHPDDSLLLPIPNHVSLNHLMSRPRRMDMVVLGMNSRFEGKFVTTVLYQPMSNVIRDRRLKEQVNRRRRKKIIDDFTKHKGHYPSISLANDDYVPLAPNKTPESGENFLFNCVSQR
eukprot:TRINITY_DN1448_c0_g1_i1.p1 TRINITY_DN1448_c0_g1~~TRINITY_DN1448_c0_g1_i1.p1  ORF type:complete len:288 (-),score=85.30 TRINITY_DN1448_c0_g1_i1:40-903(-)